MKINTVVFDENDNELDVILEICAEDVSSVTEQTDYGLELLNKEENSSWFESNRVRLSDTIFGEFMYNHVQHDMEMQECKLAAAKKLKFDIYSDYNMQKDSLINVLAKYMTDDDEIDKVVEIIKEDKTLFAIYKNECLYNNLLKIDLSNTLEDIFGDA